MNNDYAELLKNAKEDTRKRSTLEVNDKYLLRVNLDSPSIAETLKILDDLKANVPKQFRGKQVKVYAIGGFSL
jgi:hypothetical protein